jgi:hypothetical protein
VFLKPLIKDMKILWEDRDKMMDASLKKEFTLKAIIFHHHRLPWSFFTVGADQR